MQAHGASRGKKGERDEHRRAERRYCRPAPSECAQERSVPEGRRNFSPALRRWAGQRKPTKPRR